MKERPILFSAPMIRALLAGTKTQTRRLVKQPIYTNGSHYDKELGDILCHDDCLPPSMMLMEVQRGKDRFHVPDVEGWEHYCPHGVPGERLWVKETFAVPPGSEQIAEVAYRADMAREGDGGPWRPSIYMPRWASRITLEVTSVRADRLQSISEDDAKAEGIHKPAGSQFWNADVGKQLPGDTPQWAFRNLWEVINGKRAPWASNPWVWVVGFRRLEQP